MSRSARRAVVIGSGPNGLAAAIVLAQAGLQVDVYEAEPEAGGGARTLPLTLPGFLHDFGSAVHPMAVASPFFSSLPLRDYGLEWIQPSAPAAHPLDDGTAVVLERDMAAAVAAFGEDGKAWRRLFGPFAEHWSELAPEILRPVSLLPRHPFLMARLGILGFPSAVTLARSWFKSVRTKALFSGLAAHSVLSLDEPLTSAFAIIFAATAHAVGWPIPRGGAKSITTALCAHLATLGGTVHTSARVDDLSALGDFDVAMCDVTPRQLLRITGQRLDSGYRHQLERYRYGPGVFKIDYALSGADTLEGRRMCARRDRSSWRNAGGSRRIGRGHAPRTCGRAALRTAGATQPVRRDTSSRRSPRRVGLLSRAQRLGGRYAVAHRGANRTLRSRLPRLRAGAQSVSLRRCWRRAMPTSSAAISAADWSTSASSSSVRRASSMPPRQKTSTSAHLPVRPAAACTACAATTPREWR